MARKPPQFEGFPLGYAAVTAAGLVRAICQHVVDGDTADFLLDLGWHQYAYASLRFRGVDTPELRGTTGATLEAARQALARVETLLLDQPVLVRSYKDRTSFDRFIGDVYFVSESLHPEATDVLALGDRRWLCITEVLLREELGEAAN